MIFFEFKNTFNLNTIVCFIFIIIELKLIIKFFLNYQEIKNIRVDLIRLIFFLLELKIKQDVISCCLILPSNNYDFIFIFSY